MALIYIYIYIYIRYIYDIYIYIQYIYTIYIYIYIYIYTGIYIYIYIYTGIYINTGTYNIFIYFNSRPCDKSVNDLFSVTGWYTWWRIGLNEWSKVKYMYCVSTTLDPVLWTAPHHRDFSGKYLATVQLIPKIQTPSLFTTSLYSCVNWTNCEWMNDLEWFNKGIQDSNSGSVHWGSDALNSPGHSTVVSIPGLDLICPHFWGHLVLVNDPLGQEVFCGQHWGLKCTLIIVTKLKTQIFILSHMWVCY